MREVKFLGGEFQKTIIARNIKKQNENEECYQVNFKWRTTIEFESDERVKFISSLDINILILLE